MLSPESFYAVVVDLSKGLPAIQNGEPFESEKSEICSFLGPFLSSLEHFIKDYIPTGLILKTNNTDFICGIGRQNNLGLIGMGSSKVEDPYYLHYHFSNLIQSLSIDETPLGPLIKIQQKMQKSFFKEVKKYIQHKYQRQNTLELVRAVGEIPLSHDYEKSNGFIVPMRTSLDLVSDSTTNVKDRGNVSRLMQFESPLSGMLNLFHAFRMNVIPITDLKPYIIQLRHRWEPSILLNLRFSPSNSNPNAWRFALSTTSTIGIYLTKITSENFPAFSLQFGSTEDLYVRLADIPNTKSYSNFENEVFRRFGPFSRGGLRGVVPISELLRIGTTEGKEETEVSAGIRRIQTDTNLQKQILKGLLALDK